MLEAAYDINYKAFLNARLLFSDTRPERGERNVALELLSSEWLQSFVRHGTLQLVIASNESLRASTIVPSQVIITLLEETAVFLGDLGIK